MGILPTTTSSAISLQSCFLNPSRFKSKVFLKLFVTSSMSSSQISTKKNLGSPNSDVKICVDDADDSKEDVANSVDDDDATVEESDEKLERTFITFSDFDTFRSNFPETKPRETQQVTFSIDILVTLVANIFKLVLL